MFKKIEFLKAVSITMILAVVCFNVFAAEKSDSKYKDQSPGYTISAYYWPNYHVDPRNEKLFGPCWTEWEIVKCARPRFEGHSQPKVPLWGYEDESEPKVMAKKIEAAAKYGVDVLIFDWYYYNDGAYLRRALDDGFLKAPNNNKVKFSLMWANHDMPDIFPAKFYQRYPNPKILFNADITRETFDKMVDDIIEKYFKHPSYWLIDGCPYFSIYDLTTFMKGIGSKESAKEVLADFRAKTKNAGFKDLHLNTVVSGLLTAPGEKTPIDSNVLINYLGFDSFTSYFWGCHAKLNKFPETDYNYMRDLYFEYWDNVQNKFNLPYFPNVTVGWDATPRICPTDMYVNAGHPFVATISGNTPQRFHEVLATVKNRLDKRCNGPKIFNICAWNEWTEGCYLEPDTVNGMAYLEAIKNVFGKKNN